MAGVAEQHGERLPLGVRRYGVSGREPCQHRLAVRREGAEGDTPLVAGHVYARAGDDHAPVADAGGLVGGLEEERMRARAAVGERVIERERIGRRGESSRQGQDGAGGQRRNTGTVHSVRPAAAAKGASSRMSCPNCST